MMEEWDELFSDAEHGELTEKQKKIIQAAIEMFAEKGYSATSTNEIARKAGVAEGTIFRHYKTKKDLLVAIVTPVMRRLVAPFIIKDINKVLDKKHETFESFLRAMIDNRKKFIEKHWPIIKILLQEIPFHPELKEMFITYVASEPLEKAKRLITDFQKRGQIIDAPPLSIMRLAMSCVAGYLAAGQLVPAQKWDDEKEMEETIQFILRGVGYAPKKTI